jgi:type VI secretion system protein ImpK
METEPIAECQAAAFATETMLLDCYMEMIAYAGYIIGQETQAAPGYEEVVKVYEDLLKRSRHTARFAGFSEDDWLQGLFTVCAYIDETLLCSVWPERAKWEQDQLQRKHFNTTAAGWEFYERLNNLKDADLGIRGVYEFVLTLGFKGRYFRTSDIGRMEDIQYTQLKGVAGNTDLCYPKTLFPEAYETETAAKNRKIKKWKNFSLLLPVAVLLPLLVFVMLYFLFDRLLDQTVAQYFGTRF